MKYELKPLPYSFDTLSPVISKEIMELHHDKHHQAYVNGANQALELLEKSRNGDTVNLKAVLRDLSFNLNGHTLHEEFWQMMRKPNDQNTPSDSLLKLLSISFGSFEAFKSEFSNAAKTVEGSGWAQLSIGTQRELVVTQLEKHNNLGINGFKPVLLLDVWEHSYYLDYKNDRGAYVDAWWKVVNWDYVETLIK